MEESSNGNVHTGETKEPGTPPIAIAPTEELLDLDEERKPLTSATRNVSTPLADVPRPESASAGKMDRLEKLRIKTQKNPWDADSWQAMLAESQQRGDVDLIRETYEVLLRQFPTSARYWIAYAEFEQKQRAFDRMEAIFERCLRLVPSVELWKFYLTHVRRVHTGAGGPPEKKQEARAKVLKAYEFVLQNVGVDKEAGFIWSDYIQFIKAGETSSIYEDQQKMDSLRRAYHRAIWIPLTNIEQIWKDYDAFENGLNKLTAKKFLSEKSAGYMTARTALREVKNLLDPIDKAQKLWMAKPPSWTEKELQILAAWKRLIAWERSNPLRLDDRGAWINRVVYAYKSALLMLRHYPEIYYDAASFLKEVGRTDEAATMLRSGIDTLPTSLLLNLSFAELEESRKKDMNELQKIFDTLISHLELRLDEINAKYDAERDRLMAGMSKDEEAGGPDDWDGERREREREKLKEKQKEVEQKVDERRKKELENTKKALSLVWIVYMRTARRAQNVKASRAVFSRARKSAHCTYHIWVAGALMEYYSNKDRDVAGRMFEVGLKTFAPADDPQAPDFILNYLDFLINLNDENNTRALFERALSALPSARAKPIWAKFLSYEMSYGDLANVLKIEKRRADAYPTEQKNSLSSLSDIAERWGFLDIDQVGEFELGLPAQRAFEKKTPGMTGLPLSATNPLSGMQMSKSEDRAAQRKFQSLEPVHPERYPRPDLNKWSSYKPEPAALKPPAAFGAGGSPAPTASPSLAAGVPSPAQVTGISGSRLAMVPEAIATLMSVLPPSSLYNGPILPINDILELFRQIPLPIPSVPPKMVPLQPSVQGSSSSGPTSDRQLPPFDRQRGYGDRNYGRDRTKDEKGGSRGRGRGGRFDGGRSSVKRRGGFDEDQAYDGPTHINRPPENDIFRARHQFKRFRESAGSDT
ncbi:uncharacterized protein SPPG_04928 [Spizellomyces punctatus DAOM BR117]|uniref:Suppressor of forked domain-containing protein n=1 Tax=Spizellomyces punctatus (strain DAOM BR117) TaxID=645134 RepID=A0A0L0HFH2_SPIPD|nr:uncharacterized protein SPPG_04928 [Spizellomyces punctatus DAOM BR117]KNC99538.1 hypothetical protein SPPG_04928 [Spizellomyces punctatus DAOM BR117]|eukprot:XP_016607578.1 hypothetical protein SPPG_04928 [Spizellomyces punctatus DAOM BR117]